MISAEVAKECHMGLYAVCVFSHFTVQLTDGTRLSLRIWVPKVLTDGQWFGATKPESLYLPEEAASDNDDVSYPSILEHLPYRKSDVTYPRDYCRHTWFCSHGYVCVRVDMRGTGSSSGLYFDEYTQEELNDACEVIHWISEQPWSNGRVGMYGKSWGGFNGLQVAALRPPALRAVISLYSSDDRYATDVHYDGGAVLGQQMLAWSSFMLIHNALPPDPTDLPDTWLDEWRSRLSRTAVPWVRQWLSHQTRGDYWRHGSVCEDYTRMHQCPVLAIGGWRDAYYDTVFRMVQQSQDLPHVRGIVGPWAHEWPDTAQPGPQMDYLGECLCWWDHHLKGADNGAMTAPRLRCYLLQSFRPEPQAAARPGQWLTTDCGAAPTAVYVPTARGALLQHGADAGPGAWLTAHPALECGAFCGEWLSFGGADNPLDQRPDDAYSLTWTSEPLRAALRLLGLPRLSCRVRVAAGDRALLCVRLCDVHPDGCSNLMTYGVLNLCHRRGHGPDQVQPVVPGQQYDVDVELHAVGYSVAEGHSLRLAVSPSYWPTLWPAPDLASIDVQTAHSALHLPLLPDDAKAPEGQFKDRLHIDKPYTGPIAKLTVDPAPRYSVKSIREWDTNSIIRRFSDDRGTTAFVYNGQTFSQTLNSEYSIIPDRPLSAKAVNSFNATLTYPESGRRAAQQIELKTTSCMTANRDSFFLEHKIDVDLNGNRFHSQAWSDEMKRDHV